MGLDEEHAMLIVVRVDRCYDFRCFKNQVHRSSFSVEISIGWVDNESLDIYIHMFVGSARDMGREAYCFADLNLRIEFG